VLNKQLTTTKDYVRKNKLFLQNEPNFRKSQMNLSNYMTMNYAQMDTWSIRKNEPKTNPNEPKTNPISKNAKMNLTTCLTMNYEQRTMNDEKKRTQNEPNSNPISRAKNSCARLSAILQCLSENFDKPGVRKAGCSARPKLRTDPMNLLGTMPAKEGKIHLKHSFCRSAFCFMFSVTEPRP
jgi:hypothetical protein